MYFGAMYMTVSHCCVRSLGKRVVLVPHAGRQRSNGSFGIVQSKPQSLDNRGLQGVELVVGQLGDVRQTLERERTTPRLRMVQTYLP